MDLVKESFGDSLYGKAMECVKSLREEAIKVRQRCCSCGQPVMYFCTRALATQLYCSFGESCKKSEQQILRMRDFSQW